VGSDTTDDKPKWTVKQEKQLTALAAPGTGATVRDMAKWAGCHRTTMWRNLQNPEFAAEVERRQQQYSAAYLAGVYSNLYDIVEKGKRDADRIRAGEVLLQAARKIQTGTNQNVTVTQDTGGLAGQYPIKARDVVSGELVDAFVAVTPDQVADQVNSGRYVRTADGTVRPETLEESCSWIMRERNAALDAVEQADGGDMRRDNPRGIKTDQD
jgi:hypothetical protein